MDPAPYAPPMVILKQATALHFSAQLDHFRGQISPVWVLLGVSLLLRALGFAYPFIGFHLADRGHGTQAAGIVLAALGAGWAAGQLMCGWMLDRIGRRMTLAATMLATAIALAATAELHSLVALTISALATGLFWDGCRPAIGALMFDLVPDNQRRARLEAWRVGCVANVGALICGGIGAFANSSGVSLLFWLNAFGCAIVAAAALTLLPSDHKRTVDEPTRGYRQVLGNRRFVLLWLSGLATLTSFMSLYTALPMIMSAHGFGTGAYGVVFMVNAVTVIVVSPSIAGPLGKALASRARPDLMIATGMAMAAGMSIIGFGTSMTTFFIAVIAMGVCESAWLVIAADLVNRVAPPSLIGAYQGVWGFAAASAAVLSPIIAMVAFNCGGQHWVGLTLLALGLFAALLCLPLSRESLSVEAAPLGDSLLRSKPR